MKFIFTIVASLLGSAVAQATPVEPYKMYVLNCGEVFLKYTTALTGEYQHFFRDTHLYNPCYLIQRGDQYMLWDTGLPDEFFDPSIAPYDQVGVLRYPLPEDKPLIHFFGKLSKDKFVFNYQIRRPLAWQLADMGLTPDDIDIVAVSHYHIDHVGNLELFKNSKKTRILIQRAEMEAISSPEKSARYHMPRDRFDEVPREMFDVIDGEHDVFGDGKVRILYAPGHTPGQQVLQLKFPNQDVLLSADVYHMQENRDWWSVIGSVKALFTWNKKHTKRVPFVNEDKDQTKDTIVKMEKYLKDNNIELWIQHDTSRWDKTRKSPEFYEF